MTSVMDIDTAERLTDLQRVAAVCIVGPTSAVDHYTLTYLCDTCPAHRKEYTCTEWGIYSDMIAEGVRMLADIGYIKTNPIRPAEGYDGLLEAIYDEDRTYRNVRAMAVKCRGSYDLKGYWRTRVADEIRRGCQ